MNSKRGELATSTLIIIIASLILIAGFLYGYLNEMDTLVSESYQNAKFAESSLTKGFDILEIEASDGRNNAYDEFYLVARLLPDSNEIDFDLMNIIVKTHNWSSGLVYRNGSAVQNDSGYVGHANGTGYFQVQNLISSQFHKEGQITRGETVRFYVHIPYALDHDNVIGFNLISSSGVSYPVTVHTGDTVPAMNRVLLYPKI